MQEVDAQPVDGVAVILPGQGLFLAAAVGLITGGRLGYFHGRRRIPLVGTAIFTTASPPGRACSSGPAPSRVWERPSWSCGSWPPFPSPSKGRTAARLSPCTGPSWRSPTPWARRWAAC
ncbi:hypothetical protein ACFQ3Z_08955 [Streptomyces nogalater]